MEGGWEREESERLDGGGELYACGRIGRASPFTPPLAALLTLPLSFTFLLSSTLSPLLPFYSLLYQAHPVSSVSPRDENAQS